MPTPHKGESEQDFVSRCIPIVMKEGTAKDQKQAAAVCYSMHRDHMKKRNMEEFSYRSASITPGTIDEESRSVEVVVATENPVKMPDFERMEMVPETLLMAGAKLPRNRQIPLLDNHGKVGDAHDLTVKKQLGSIRNLRIENNQLVGRAHFSKTAEDEWIKVREGHITDVSVGYGRQSDLEKVYVPRGRTQTVQGRSFNGPMNVVTQWPVREGSITPIGADEMCKVRGIYPSALVDAENNTRMNGNLTMEKELRDLLVSRGMPADLSDVDALKWLNEHRSEVFAKDDPTRSVSDDTKSNNTRTDNEGTRTAPPEDIDRLVRQAVGDALPGVFKLERERIAKFRSEVDSLLEISGFKTDLALAERCYQCSDIASARAEILKYRQERTVDVGIAPAFRPGDFSSVEKFSGCMGTALLMRCLNNNEQLAERACREEVRFGRPTPFGRPETWQERKQRSAGWEPYQNLSLLGLATECLRYEGIDTRYLANWQIAQAALGYLREAGVRSSYFDNSLSIRGPGNPAYHTTGSFTSLTLDAMNKTMLAGYVERPFTWEGPFRRAPSAPDFKKIYRVRLGEFPNLEATPDNTAPNQASFMDERESYAVEAYSKEISFSWQLLVNDDMDALSRTPRMMGVAANRTVNAFAWNMIELNATLQDGQAWFSAATGNRLKANLIASGSGAPTLARLQAMRLLMRVQVGVNTREGTASSAILNLEPRYWAVPAALELVARQILFSPFSPDATNSITFNQFNQGNANLQLVVEPLLDSQTNGATASILFCDPAQCDTAEIAFLQGQETPYTRSYMDDKTMAMCWQIWQTFGGKPIDFRGVVRDKGIA